MNKIVWLALIVFACTPAKKEKPETVAVPAEQVEITVPALTDAEKAEGWKLLFDGKSLNGWQIFKGQKNSSWEAKNGMLHCKSMNDRVQADGNQLVDIITTEQYENFELSFDFKLTADANSGVMYRVTEEFDQPYSSGPEYQLLDDEGFPDQDKTHYTGAVFGLYATTSKPLKSIGNWNKSKIVVNKNRVEHWLNGQKILEYEINSADWRKRIAAGSWKDAKGFGQASKGHLDFQDRGSEVWFKNVMIKSL